MDNDMFDEPQPDNVTISNGILRYSKQFPDPAPLTTHGDPLDDYQLVASDGMKMLPKPDQTINLNVNFSSYTLDGQQVQRYVV
jgi:iron transport multicopper oxidase